MTRQGPLESCLRDQMNMSWREPDPEQRYRLAYDEVLDQKYTWAFVEENGWVCQERDEDAFDGPWWTSDGNLACVVFSARLLGAKAAPFWELTPLLRASFLNDLQRQFDFGNAYYGHIGNTGEIVMSFEILEPMNGTG